MICGYGLHKKGRVFTRIVSRNGERTQLSLSILVTCYFTFTNALSNSKE